MAKRKTRKSSAKRPSRGGGRPVARTPADERQDALIRSMSGEVLQGAGRLVMVEDPLEAEQWASMMLGLFYKLPLPLLERENVERRIGPAIVAAAEEMHTTTGLAALLALAAVTADDIGAESAARRLLDAGVQPPRWAGAIGSPDLLDCWSTTDAFGDQTAYYFGFRYAGQGRHLTMALVDQNLGGIVKDAVNAPLKDDRPLAEMLNTDPDVPLEATEPAAAAVSVLAALATGDQFIDNYWTDDFKDNRALLLARMRGVAEVAQVDPPIPEPPDIQEQERLTQDFMASDLAPPGDETLPIVDQCVISRCHFGDGDPLPKPRVRGRRTRRRRAGRAQGLGALRADQTRAAGALHRGDRGCRRQVHARVPQGDDRPVQLWAGEVAGSGDASGRRGHPGRRDSPGLDG